MWCRRETFKYGSSSLFGWSGLFGLGPNELAETIEGLTEESQKISWTYVTIQAGRHRSLILHHKVIGILDGTR
jgi:hypothetical protein